MANGVTTVVITAVDQAEYDAMKAKIEPSGVKNLDEVNSTWSIAWDDANLKVTITSPNYVRTNWN